MNFAEYLWELLSRPYRPGSELKKWLEAYGVSLDELKDAVFRLRRAWVVGTAEGHALDAHGGDRGMPRLAGEADDSYRRRLEAAYHVYAMGGTMPGMKEALRAMGYPNAVVHELFKDGETGPRRNGQYFYNGSVQHRGGVRWAEFSVKTQVEEGRSFTRQDAVALRGTVARMKPAHTMLAAIVILAALDDYLAMQDAVAHRIAAALGEQLGSYGVHDGFRRDGTRIYGGTFMFDRMAVSVAARPGFAEFSGGRPYGGVIRHSGGGPRWRHTGAMLRVPRVRYDGRQVHSGVSRIWAQNRYGDKLLARTGMIRYSGGFMAHDGRVRRDEGISDGVDIVVRRRGAPIEKWVA